MLLYPDGTKKTIYEHREIVERTRGIKLRPDQHVHHVNEHKTDNADGNLEVLLPGEHLNKHRKPVTMLKLTCSSCGKEFNRSKQRFHPNAKPYCSRHCNGVAAAKRNLDS